MVYGSMRWQTMHEQGTLLISDAPGPTLGSTLGLERQLRSSSVLLCSSCTSTLVPAGKFCGQSHLCCLEWYRESHCDDG
jgi:hypothetical protein